MVYSYVSGMDGEKKVLIIQLSGGLGNQLFQYALYEKLKSINRKVKMDDSTCYHTDKRRNNQLNLIGVEYESASINEIQKLTDSSMLPWNRLRRKLFGRKDKTIFEDRIIMPEDCWRYKIGYFQGYWQGATFFKGAEGSLRNLVFSNKDDWSYRCKTVLEKISACKSVSIHIRRGDYLGAEQQKIYGNICTMDYYASAIEYIKSKVPQSHFFAFSNDPQWVTNNLKIPDLEVVNISNEQSGYLDMYLMSKCQHNILANSSFSWWGAWLNNYNGKIVIGPQKWTNTLENNHIYDEIDVIQISADGEIVNG